MFVKNTRTKSSPPRLTDFSESAINKTVVKNSFTHWLTMYPPALGLPLGLAALLFNMPMLYLAMLGTISIGLASLIINIFFRHDKIASAYLENLNAEIKKQEQHILDKLGFDLRKSTGIPGAEIYASQGGEQLSKVQEKFHNIQVLLEAKLIEGEITFIRFAGAAEQLYLATLDNLKQVATTLQSVSSIDPGYIKERMEYLQGLDKKSGADSKEIKTLRKREKLRNRQLKKINDILTLNEEAMTEMEETTASIATMQTDRKLADIDYEAAIQHLQEMTQRSQMYQ